jgi:hypothetical protein
VVEEVEVMDLDKGVLADKVAEELEEAQQE